jgi:4-amino-4-deoxy-L-arabinose transferase-like glycosyltransferase
MPDNPRGGRVGIGRGGAALGGAAAFLLAAAVLVTFPRAPGRDFFPHPDASEYVWVAQQISAHASVTLPVGDLRLPSRYPPGYPLFLAAFLRLPGVAPPDLVLVSLLVAAFAGAVVFHLAGRRAGWTAGGIALAVLLASPGFLTNATRVMATVPSLLWALLLLGAWTVRREGGGGSGFAVGLLAGYGILVHVTNVLLLAPYLLLAALDLRSAERRRFGLFFLVAVCFWGCALMALDTHLYGAPLRTGYGYWIPSLYRDLGEVVNAQHLWSGRGGPYAGGTLLAHLRAMVGLYGREEMQVNPLAWFFFLAGVVAAWRGGRREREFGFLLAASFACVLLFLGLYRWPTSRLLVPVVGYVAVGAGLGFAALERGIAPGGEGSGARVVVRALAVALAALSIWTLGHVRDDLISVKPREEASAALPGLAALVPPGSLVLSDVLIPLVDIYFLPHCRAELEPLLLSTPGSHVWQEDHARQYLNQHPGWAFLLGGFRQWQGGGFDSPSADELAGDLASGRRVFLLTGYASGTDRYRRDFETFVSRLQPEFGLRLRGERDLLGLYELLPGDK